MDKSSDCHKAKYDVTGRVTNVYVATGHQ